MTLVIEYRLKCDYCGNCSTPYQFGDPEPMGWVTIMFWNSGAPNGNYHFCTAAHHEKWIEDHTLMEGVIIKP